MKSIFRTASIAALFLIPLDGMAQGWFAGVSAGLAQQQDFEVGGVAANGDDSDTTLRLFGGYLVTPRQGVVASLVDLGDTSYAGPAFGGFTDEHEAEGIDVSYLIGWAPGNQERISIFGTVGIFAWDQEVLFSDTTGSILFKDEGTSFSLGFGADFNFSADGTNPWGVHVQYQLFKDVGDEDNSGHEIDRDALSVGVSYRFGGSR